MAVFKTYYNGTEIRCVNLTHTNNTLVVAPSINGERETFVIFGMCIAEEILKNKIMLKHTFEKLVQKQELFRTMVAN